jgi:hypothetical protein
MFIDCELTNQTSSFIKLVLQRVELGDEINRNRCGKQMYIYNIMVTYIHSYHSRFIPEGVAEASQIFLQDIHVLPKLVSYEKHRRRDRW